ncbi:hypothetical protein ACWDR2_01250 [Streptomyces sp. NPDC003631]|uniref:hypothetical protein n=1 Tax=unclassified Streptomyces TaxID=2593676 RepID=UPI0036B316B6
MGMRGRGLKFTAALALVALALTGFSGGRHGSRSRHGSGGGGGGCSSSRQDHDGYSSSTSTGGSGGSVAGDDSYGSASSGGIRTRRPTRRSTPTSTASGTAGSLADGTARLVRCASPGRPYATVEVRNPNGRAGRFRVQVVFQDGRDTEVAREFGDVRVPAEGRATVEVALGPGLVDAVDHCRADPVATVH